jgi:hypothetical protein
MRYKELFQIGHDSEFPLLKGTSIVSALDALGERVYEDPAGRYFADNMNCEIAINPVKTEKKFHEYTTHLLNKVKEEGYSVAMVPVVKYPSAALQHPLAYISGCNPDLSAYTEEENEAPDFTQMDSSRSCGAHVHVEHGDELSSYNLAKWMDAFLALPLLFREIPSKRRSMYGGAGCIRVKPYGTEYRTLSNNWLNDEKLRSFVWENTHKAVAVAKKKRIEDFDPEFIIPQAIDRHDLDLAARALDMMYVHGVSKI